MRASQRVFLLAIGVVLTGAACDAKKAGTADSVAAKSAQMSADTMMAKTPPPAPAPTLTDANIVYILDGANAADSARGTLAATKGTSADVKNFGKMMAGEHHALRAEGIALATKLSVTPAAPAGDVSAADAKMEMDKLMADAKGAAWDKAYIDYEVTYHGAVLTTATAALAATSTQPLKDLIGKAAPIIQKHLDRAKEIQVKQAK